MKLLSLFSGIGAFEKALENLKINYELVGFSEIDKYAIESYSAIHNVSTDKNLGDISTINTSLLPSDIDVITYGFPCQDISVAGKMNGIKKNETRSGLLYEAERIIQDTKPKFAIAENVKNLVSKKFKNDFNELLQRLDSYGYNNYWKVLNAKDYGIPQNRERVFIVSIRKDIDDGSFIFPQGFKLKKAIKDILEEHSEEMFLSEKIQQRYVEFPNRTKKRINEINILGTTGPDKTIGQRDIVYCIDNIIGCLIATEYKQPKQIMINGRVRKITPLESWRLMGFSDNDYFKAKEHLEKVFYNGRNRSGCQMFKQPGNSICVTVLEYIFKQLLRR